MSTRVLYDGVSGSRLVLRLLVLWKVLGTCLCTARQARERRYLHTVGRRTGVLTAPKAPSYVRSQLVTVRSKI